MMDPRSRFRVPEEVLRDPSLTDTQKIDILRRWAQDERQLAVAVDEGMPGPEPTMLRRVEKALGELEQEP